MSTLDEFREFVDDWAKAYPLTVFPEPDLKRAAELLKAGGGTLDAVSASMGRHVITRIKERLDAVTVRAWLPCPRPFSLPDDAPFFVRNSNGFLAAATYVHEDGGASYDTSEGSLLLDQCSDVTHYCLQPEQTDG